MDHIFIIIYNRTQIIKIIKWQKFKELPQTKQKMKKFSKNGEIPAGTVIKYYVIKFKSRGWIKRIYDVLHCSCIHRLVQNSKSYHQENVTWNISIFIVYFIWAKFLINMTYETFYEFLMSTN